MLEDLVLADPALPRFVFWEGKLHALPGGVKDLLNFDLLTCESLSLLVLLVLHLILRTGQGQERFERDWEPWAALLQLLIGKRLCANGPRVIWARKRSSASLILSFRECTRETRTS